MKVKGITLVSLVITVIVMLILAGVSLSMILGNNSNLFEKTRNSGKIYQESVENENKTLNDIISSLDYAIYSDKIFKNIPKENENIKYFSSQVVLEDEKGNKVIVPKNFGLAKDSGSYVEDGVVIEDQEGNQYVWVPVSGNDNRSIIKKDDSNVEIKLARYRFTDNNDENPGTPIVVQDSSEYAETTFENYNEKTQYLIRDLFYELADYNSGVKSEEEGRNATAKDLKAFVESVNKNHGFYIARYEAGITSDKDNFDLDTPLSVGGDIRPQSKKGLFLWNGITQPDASFVCQNLYDTIQSDLINSYAWDTAVVYIEKMKNSNYANQNSLTNMRLKTGLSGDEECKINDLASNNKEWLTSYSTYVIGTRLEPCTNRGGYLESTEAVTNTYYRSASTSIYGGVTFRTILYF